MISLSPLFDKLATDLPRRDLVAIFQYLNRKELDANAKRQASALAENRLGKLAAASRMQ